MRYLHLRLATSEAASAVVDQAVAALADAGRFRAVVQHVDDGRLRDLLSRVRARMSEQPEPDALGCALIALALIPRIPRGTGFLDVEPTRYVLWFIEDMLETVEPITARADVAREVIEHAPTLSLQVELLYRFRVPPDGPSKEPKLDLLDEKAFNDLRRSIADTVRAASIEELSDQDKLLWALELLREEAGPEAVLARLSEEPVLRAVLTSTGTRVRPISDGRLSLHLEPLVALAGEEILNPLSKLAGDAEALHDDVRDALRKELDRIGDGSRSPDDE